MVKTPVSIMESTAEAASGAAIVRSGKRAKESTDLVLVGVTTMKAGGRSPKRSTHLVVQFLN